MPGGKHETIAIEPFRIRRIESQRLAKENSSNFSSPERESKVTGIACVHRINREASRDVGGGGKYLLVHGGISFVSVLRKKMMSKAKATAPQAANLPDHCKWFGISLQALSGVRRIPPGARQIFEKSPKLRAFFSNQP
jgi:hypothetical protein